MCKQGWGGTKYVPYLYISLRFDLSGRELGGGGGVLQGTFDPNGEPCAHLWHRYKNKETVIKDDV